jgi:N-acetylmuramoyl-L-alanine amidase
MRTWVLRIPFVLLLTSIAAVPAVPHAEDAATAVERLYLDAAAKETAVQKALGDPDASRTTLRAVHTVVSDFESIVRQYPSSGYADDALWRAAKVSIDAFKRFRDARDKDAATRLLRALSAQYPTSRQAKQVPAQLRALEALEPMSAVGTTSAAPPPEPAAAASVPIASAPPAPLATIKGIRRTVLNDTVRIIVDLDMEVPFHDERLANPSRVFVDLPSTRSNPSLIDRTIRFDSDSDIVRQVRVGRHPNRTTRIVLDADGVSSYSVYPLYNPYRLVIDCLRAAPAEPAKAAVAVPAAPPPLLARIAAGSWARAWPAAPPSNGALLAEAMAPQPTPTLPVMPITPPATPALAGAASRNITGGFSIARQLGLGVSRIVIDPGHGGHDPGAKGAGTTEAELVLDVALRVEKLLTKVPGVEVVLTRRTDEFVPLQERTAIANREAADLFLSIHANASSSPQARGIETYFLNFANNLSSAAVAARENASSGQTMATLPDVVKTIALNNKLDESRDFATYVQRSMIEKLRASNKTARDLGVKQAPFVVLIGAAMPSVLAEVSFLTNAQEARLLKGAAYRQRIAEALFDAVRKYQTSLKSAPSVAQQ